MKTEAEKKKMIRNPVNERQFLRNLKHRHEYLIVKRHTSKNSMRAL